MQYASSSGSVSVSNTNVVLGSFISGSWSNSGGAEYQDWIGVYAVGVTIPTGVFPLAKPTPRAKPTPLKPPPAKPIPAAPVPAPTSPPPKPKPGPVAPLWRYVLPVGATSGSFSTAMQTTSSAWVPNTHNGAYKLYYFCCSSYAIIAQSPVFNATITPAVSVSMSTRSVSAGQPLTATWQAPAGASLGDWIGLFPLGATPDSTNVLWSTVLVIGKTSGSLDTRNMSASLPFFSRSGQSGYVFAYLCCSSYIVMAYSEDSTVNRRLEELATVAAASGRSLDQTEDNAAAASVSISAPIFCDYHTPITAFWSGPAASYLDWVGLYLVGDSATSTAYYWWKYVSTGSTGGTISTNSTTNTPGFAMPINGGPWELRYYKNGDYSSLVASSDPISVGYVPNKKAYTRRSLLEQSAYSEQVQKAFTTPTVTVSNGAVPIGQPVYFSYTAPGAVYRDWIGVYDVGANIGHDTHLWKLPLTEGVTSGSSSTASSVGVIGAPIPKPAAGGGGGGGGDNDGGPPPKRFRRLMVDVSDSEPLIVSDAVQRRSIPAPANASLAGAAISTPTTVVFTTATTWTPSAPNTCYRLYYFCCNTYAVVSQSQPFCTPSLDQTVSVYMSSSCVAAGRYLTGSWSYPAGANQYDWVGLYRTGQAYGVGGSAPLWSLLLTQGATSGTLDTRNMTNSLPYFTTSSCTEGGSYFFVYFCCNSYNVLTTSN